MRKTDVISHFGTQQKVAEAMTAAGFPISQRGVSGWPDPIPLERAVIIERITKGTKKRLRVDFALYERHNGAAQ